MRFPRQAGGLARLMLAAGIGLGGLAGAPAVVPGGVTRAADTDLTLVTNARYDVEPGNDRIRVTVDIVATNHRAETTTRRFYFDRAYLAVMPGTSDFAVSGSTKPKVGVSKRTASYTMLRLDFGSRLYGGRSTELQLTFDLADPGGAPDRKVRVDASLVAFPVWAFASDGAAGSSASITFPPGYEVVFESGDAPASRKTTDTGEIVFETGPLAEPLTYFTYVLAEGPGAYEDVARTVELPGSGSVELVLRSWSDDPAWADRVSDLWVRGLPLIAGWVGIAWPRAEPLVVQEAVTRSQGGYAGSFDPAEGRIEVAYWAPSLVVLHEAAHGWFNGTLLADRWANEGFASLYAERAAAALGLEDPSPEVTEELAASAIPLNAWGLSGSVDDATEAYGFAASLALARAIAQRAGDDALRAVWSAAAGGVGAYQPPAPGANANGAAPDGGGTTGDPVPGDAASREPTAADASGNPPTDNPTAENPPTDSPTAGSSTAGATPTDPTTPAGPAPGAPSSADPARVAPEPAAGPPDWRGLLDLLEDTTGQSFDDLWRTWVVRPDEALLLDVRVGARRSYERTLALADGWALPAPIREALRAWQFPAAESMLADARTVLAQRDALAADSARLGIELPGTLRTLFEGGGTLAEASAEAAAESSALATIESARLVRPVDPDVLTAIGLLGTTPEEDLDRARESFTAGRLDAAVAAAEQASGDWTGAWEEGRRRALLGIAVAAVLAVMFSATLGGLRRRAVARVPTRSQPGPR